MNMTEHDTLQRLMEAADVRQYDCYQCGKCSGGCPMADPMDLKPRGLMRCAQVGSLQRILHSNTIWLCTGCHACVDRCPHDVNVPALIEQARYEAMRRGISSRDSEVLNRTFIANLKAFGRSHEMLLAGLYNIFALKPFQDLASVPHMLRKGLIKPVPERIRGASEVAELIERAEKWDSPALYGPESDDPRRMNEGE
ncbi:MAG: 4Fe-4S dicluster domain-containing protein [Clostridiales bacterium]|nr:4Fe-4S dicluster domain-containing protein [Clostridiales bacterium]